MLTMIQFWLRSSVVSVLFSLISERVLLELNRDYSNFCTEGAHPLGLPMIAPTVSLVLHCLQTFGKVKSCMRPIRKAPETTPFLD
ncbi:uncharacterized protein F4807DRAFT_292201 [Annulohypoxylon truncatum]|uniref:uncharacterized protein n=1 Tax=Annulohypoxylon truncatum TaxID=327061 RepID=UPI002008C372|nr:uncharacterized protein F4807DRAFT_292201 [Annulohypoxylon truncatum]KAI1205271.1 hypothetical protein F4807DRAFT_292201 [Annulohypoxylon truncatum]